MSPPEPIFVYCLVPSDYHLFVFCPEFIAAICKQVGLGRRRELEESTYLTSGSITKPRLPRQYGTGTKTKILINGTK